MKRIIMAVALMLAVVAAGHAESHGMTKIIYWCMNETLNRQEMPGVCIELLSGSLLDDVKEIIKVLGLVDADGKLATDVLASAARCAYAAWLTDIDAFDYPTIVECAISAAAVHAPPADSLNKK